MCLDLFFQKKKNVFGPLSFELRRDTNLFYIASKSSFKMCEWVLKFCWSLVLFKFMGCWDV